MIRNKFIIPFWLLRDALVPIFTAFLVLSTLVFFQQVSRNSELLFSPLIGWKSINQILLSLIPPIITFTLPVAIAIGETIAISRLVMDCEWIALEANSLTKTTRFGPFIFLGLLGSLLILGLNWSLAPRSIANLKNLRTALSGDKVLSQVKPQLFISQFPNHLIRVKAVDPGSGKWEGVILLRKEEKSDEIQLLAAQSGSLTPLDNNFESFEVKLSNGVYIKNLLSASDHVTSAFKENTLKVLPEKQRDTNAAAETVSAKEAAQLLSMSDLLQRRKDPGSLKKPNIEYELEFSKRLANALAALFAACCATVLASHSRPRQARRMLLFVGCFLFMVVYYASLTFGQNLALKEAVDGRGAMALGSALPFGVLFLVNLTLKNNWLTWPSFAKVNRATQKLSKLSKSAETEPKFIEQQAALEINDKFFSFNLGHYLILSEFIQFLLMAVVLLSATVLLFTMLDIAPSVTKNQIPLGFALGYLAKYAPQIVYYMLPFSVLIAVVGAATSLARTGQLTLLIYYAANPLRLAAPVILLVLAVCTFVFFLSDSILPFTNRDQDNRYRLIKGKSTEEVTVAFDRQWVSNEEASLLYGYRISNLNGQSSLNALAIRLANPNYYLSEITYLDGIPTTVDQGTTPTDGSPTIFQYQIGLDGLAKVQTLNRNEIPMELSKPTLIYDKTYHEASKMTFKQLKTYIRQMEKTGLPTVGLRMELAQKYAFPFACLTLMFLAFPICLIQIHRQHQSRLSAILISVSLALIFWAILSIFEAAGKRGTIPITLAAWSPHALFLALAATIQLKLHYQ